MRDMSPGRASTCCTRSPPRRRRRGSGGAGRRRRPLGGDCRRHRRPPPMTRWPHPLIRRVAPMVADYHVEPFSADERVALAPYVTNLDRPVFGLTNLPQVTAAALFARYSRSSKSLRRLLLDEFLGDEVGVGPATTDAGRQRASDLFGRVLAAYGDDSVAQLGGVHVACEQVSQPLAKAIEWGRLAGYLEQSTRYIPYTDRRDGRYRYHVDPALATSPASTAYVEAMDGLFNTY